MAERFEGISDKDLADMVGSGHVDAVTGQAEVDRRAKASAKAPAGDASGDSAADADGTPDGDGK